MSLNKEVEFKVGDITITAPTIDLVAEGGMMTFPYSEIITGDEYKFSQLFPYGFALSDLTPNDEESREEPITDAKDIVMVLPKDDDVKIYFY